MSKIFSLSSLAVGITSLAFSAGVWANMDNMMLDTNWMDDMYQPDYMVTDMDTHRVDYWDGVDKGHEVADDGAMHRYDCVKGDKLTNLHTNKSGIITGVKKQGTMDVMTKSGKTVRYQYVIFKVKPL